MPHSESSHCSISASSPEERDPGKDLVAIGPPELKLDSVPGNPAPSRSTADTGNELSSTPDEYLELRERLGRPMQQSKIDRKVNAIEHAVERPLQQLPSEIGTSLVTGLKDFVAAPAVREVLDKSIDHFLRTVPSFIQALDEVAKIHPVIQGVVLIFKAIYTLERKRRDNDKRVAGLFAEMTEMLGILLDLKAVSPSTSATGNNDFSTSNFRKHLQGIARDMRECANACDAYAKKSFIAKALQSMSWNVMFEEFSNGFKESSRALHLDISILTVKKVSDVQTNVDFLACLFKEDAEVLCSDTEISARRAVLRHGGRQVVLADEQKLHEVVVSTNGHPASATTAGLQIDGSDVRDLVREAQELPSNAVKRNRGAFLAKFDFIHDHIDDVMRLIAQESDRIFGALTDGVHCELQDKTIRYLWMQHKWGGTVTTHHFIIALREYYLTRMAAENLAENTTWALGYLDIEYARPIAEALDADASGFVTVTEMNDFLGARPKHWSTPLYIAYWAIGWRQLQIKYAQRITANAQAIHDLQESGVIHESNRAAFTHYISRTTYATHAFTNALALEPANPKHLPAEFEQYAEIQETGIREKLTPLNYIIEGRSVPETVLGTSRLEKCGLVLLDLILARHVEIMSEAQHRELPDVEFAQAAASLEHLAEAFIPRAERVSHGLALQRLDLATEFQSFAFGLLHCAHDPRRFHAQSESTIETLTESTAPSTEPTSTSGIEKRLDLIQEKQTYIYDAVMRIARA